MKRAFSHALMLVCLNCAATPMIAAGEGPVRVTFGVLLKGLADLPVGEGVEELLARMPEEVSRLNGREVVLTGYVLPKSVENGRMREGVITRAPDTCGHGHAYNHTHSAAERVVVRSAQAGISVPMDVPVTVRGTLRVSPERRGSVLTAYYVIENAEVVSSVN